MSNLHIHNEALNVYIKGGVFTARTGKLQYRTGVSGQLNMFYVPSRMSLLCKSGDAFSDDLMNRYEGSGRTLNQRDLYREHPMEKSSANMKAIPIEGLCYGIKKSFDIAPYGRPIKVPSIVNMKEEACGTITTNMKFGVRDGIIMSLFAKSRLDDSFGSPSNSCGVFIQARSTASYKRISARLPIVAGAAYQDCMVEGRFDILSVKEAYQEGIVPLASRQLEAIYDPVFFKDVFTLKELSSELQPKPVMTEVKTTNEDGNVVTVKRPRKTRIIGEKASL